MLPHSDTCVPSPKCLLPLAEWDIVFSPWFLLFIFFFFLCVEKLIAALQGDHSRQVILHHRNGCAYIQFSSGAPGPTDKHS